MSVKRIFVEKKEGYDVEARHAFNDIKYNLGINKLEGLRIINRYDVEDVSDDELERCKRTIFSEPPVDRIYDETLDVSDGEYVFAVKYLPGQYDKRADSAVQCIMIVTGNDKAQVEAAKVYVCKGNLSDGDIKKIKGYCINPVDSAEAALHKSDSLKIETTHPDDIPSVAGFIDMTPDEIAAMKNDMGLAMSADDLLHCQTYFKNEERRNPTLTEIRVIDTYWSDHCRHTTFLTAIEDVRFQDGCYKDMLERVYNEYLQTREKLNIKKDVTLMDIATIGMKALKASGALTALDESDENNACSIVADVSLADGKTEQWLILFKNETHNHPTEIEPYGGAATCLGGAIRDPLSGRAYVYQAMRVTGSGDPRTPVEDTLPGKLPQRKITTGAALGYSSYGNQIGIATGQVAEIYDEGYVAKRMEIGAVIGAVKKADVTRITPEAGDVIILVGGRTGRDGCGGATGSSKAHTEQSITTCGAEVQKGNPPTERKLQRLFRNPAVSKMIKKCNDFGAGGVSVAIGELADGLAINLDSVPKKYDGLDGTELAISESQERMAVVVARGDADAFIAHAADENLEATPVAVVLHEERLKMMWRGAEIVNISRAFLNTNGARQTANAVVTCPPRLNGFTSTDVGGKEAWLRNLSALNVAGQKGLVEMFDSTIGSGTVLMPYGGVRQLTPPETMAAKVPVLDGDTDTVTLMSYGYNPALSKQSPFHGAALAVVESVSKIIAAGGEFGRIYLTFQEYFEKMTGEPEKWGKPLSALLGGFYAQTQLGIAAIGGKDSMSGTFNDINVPPTLVSFAVGVSDAGRVLSPEFKKKNSLIVLLKTAYDGNDLPDFELLVRNYKGINALNAQKRILAAATVGTGDIAAAISKMCLGNYIGACVECLGEAPMYGAFIIEVESVDGLDGLDFTVIGKTNDSEAITYGDVVIPLTEVEDAWLKPLEGVFPTERFEDAGRSGEDVGVNKNVPVDSSRGASALSGTTELHGALDSRTQPRISSPRVFIPVFPGTNCEYDTARAFTKAGGTVNTLVIRNLNKEQLEASIAEMAALIKGSQIIAIPGGFSAGDEPDGSGKFIAAVFRNPAIKEAVMELLNNRDGLMIGICNGFQALVKLGLLPYGKILDVQDENVTLTYNKIGRHISCLSSVKVVSDKSPWLWNVKKDEVYLNAFSHGEGRFMATDAVIAEMAANGQIATQYVDPTGVPTYDVKYNPNGSTFAIEGITSADGRILGKMGHVERIGENLYKNVPGKYDMGIFEAGVGYFK